MLFLGSDPRHFSSTCEQSRQSATAQNRTATARSWSHGGRIWFRRSSIQVAYRRTDIRGLATNRWDDLRVEYVDGNATTPAQLRVQGVLVPVAKTVFFTYSPGSARAIESLTLQGADNAQRVVQFPIAAALRTAGIPTVSNIALPGK